MVETIILVDDKDKEIGFEEKAKAHLGNGKLHRSFSIFVFNDKDQLLLQKRSDKKMLWGGFWTNACCSHPLKGETLEKAVHRKLKQEFGFDCPLKEIFTFIYHEKFKDRGAEHEFDHTFVGFYNGEINPNQEEIADWKWIDMKDLRKELQNNAHNYTPWFKIAINRVVEHLSEDSGRIRSFKA